MSEPNQHELIAAQIFEQEFGCNKALEEALDVCAEAYQLIGSLSEHIPNVEKWLDNLLAGKLIHKDLLPLIND